MVMLIKNKRVEKINGDRTKEYKMNEIDPLAPNPIGEMRKERC